MASSEPSRSRSRDRGVKGDTRRDEKGRDNGRDKNEREAERKKSDEEKDGDRKRGSSGRRDRKRGNKSGRRKKSSSGGRRRSSSRRTKKRSRRSSSSDSSSSSSSSSGSSSSDSSNERRRNKSKRKSSKSKKPKSTKGSSSQPKPKGPQQQQQQQQQQPQVNAKLLSKLSQRNETLEEREERRAKRRAARITARFGYTAEDNPFRDPNLHETFTWRKKDQAEETKPKAAAAAPTGFNADDDGVVAGGGEHPLDAAATTTTTTAGTKSRRDQQEHTFAEIEKVRQRREARDLHLEEMERLRAEESKMKELENYDEWARKEEEFHLQQQRQRSAIRLVEGREKPVDVLAQNMLLFGLSDEEKENRAKVKYRERYSALEELETLESNLEEPQSLLKDLKLGELEELLMDVDAFRRLEREAAASTGVGGGDLNNGADKSGGGEDNAVIRYWDALHAVTLDEIQFLKTGGESGGHASLVGDIRDMFKGQTLDALLKMRGDIEQKLRGGAAGPRFDGNGVVDTDYWQTVLDQLKVHLAKMELSDIHSKMLVRQLEKLEVKKEELKRKALSGELDAEEEKASAEKEHAASGAQPLPLGVEPDFGNLEEELGLNDEIDLNADANAVYAWQDKYRPRKPRYFNRVKTGYDWNAYNKTHYDHDNPPPKTVQGYKFNVFYPDLIDRSKTPQYHLERADTDDFCILRFSAGPPYEDVAFKIINRQWNKSRKRGFRCTFERGVLSLYFNFASHWYRR